MTEAIGTLYGDEDDSVPDNSRPLSFIPGSPYQEQLHMASSNQEHLSPEPRRILTRSQSDQTPSPTPYHGEHGSLRKAQTLSVQTQNPRNGGGETAQRSPRSPTMPSLREVQADPSTSQYTLTNIDNPNDIAQELSNLQALRRMSMDVGNIKDPDMPPMSLSTMPVIAPSGDDDEGDPSRLLWVPARVHPELAPGEFKSFLETRVQSIRRRSRDGSLSPDGSLSRNNSGTSLRRQKSMLSRQIDDSSGQGAGYVDGAERLARQQSHRSQQSSELSLDELVKDPTKAVQKLAQETTGEEGLEASPDDKPILPKAPGMGLRRSTRTTYRKGGSLRSGDKPSSRRVGHRFQESEDAGIPPMPEAPPGHGLTRVQSEPVAENFSRPSRSNRRGQTFALEDAPVPEPSSQDESSAPAPGQVFQDQLPIRSSSVQLHDNAGPSQDEFSSQYPQSSTSQQASPQHAEPQPEPPIAEPPPKSARRKISQPTLTQPPPQHQYTSKNTPASPSHSLNEHLSTGPSPLPGSASSRTDSLTFIPTFNQEEKKSEKKSKKDRDDDTSSVKSTSSAWKWFKGSSDDKKEKKEEGKKSKAKALVEKAQDNVRLDVIQTSIDKNVVKGRESLVLDRDSMDNKLQEERRKESNRKSDNKKEKDGNIFSSLFGGKKKEEKEKTSKKSQHLRVPSDVPVYTPQQPDVDYHWTRFPLLEERAIYRMAHIKLANPRRPLLSQVLLSNFMYSYLAIVQAMHPNMNVPVSPQQKRLEEEARRKREEEEYLAQQQMQDQDDQGLDQYDYDYHRVSFSPQNMPVEGLAC